VNVCCKVMGRLVGRCVVGIMVGFMVLVGYAVQITVECMVCVKVGKVYGGINWVGMIWYIV
jgi:hypothetical protein